MMKSNDKNQIAMAGKKPVVGLARATSIVGIFTFVSRISGLVRDAMIASLFGSGMQSDAFFVAFRIPNLMRRLLAEGTLSTAFVPLFTEELNKSTADAKRALGEVTSFCLILSTLVTLLGVYYAEELMLLFAPGFGVGTEKAMLSSYLLIIMFPYLIFISLIALYSGAANALGYFAIPAFIPVLLNVTMITTVPSFLSFTAEPVKILAFSVVFGGIISVPLQIYTLRRAGIVPTLANPFRSSVVRKLALLMIPAIVSSSTYQLVIFFNSLLSSLMAEGSVSWLYYADRLFQFPLGVFSVALGTALLPRLSALSVTGEKQSFSATLTTGINWVSAVTIPATIGLVSLGVPMVSVIYQHGSMNEFGAEQIANALTAFSVGLWAISFQGLLVRAYLARKNTKVPALISMFSLAFSVVFSIVLMGAPIANDHTWLAEAVASAQLSIGIYSLGHVGLALSGSASAVLSALLLFVFLRKVDVDVYMKPIIATIIKSLLAALVMAIAIELLKQQIHGDVAILLIAIPTGMGVYAGSAWAMRIQRQLRPGAV